MTMPELKRIAELKRLAEAATPGRWEVRGANIHTVAKTEPTYIAEVSVASLSSPRGSEQRDIDATHIAACDPPTILSLIAMVERYRDALEWIVKIADTNYEQDDKLRSQGARTLIRISDRATAALSNPTSTT